MLNLHFFLLGGREQEQFVLLLALSAVLSHDTKLVLEHHLSNPQHPHPHILLLHPHW